MVTFLLVIIYLAFLGLGLPDGLLGSSWSVTLFVMAESLAVRDLLY